MDIRKHLLSGIPWYDHDQEKLEIQIKNCFLHNKGPKNLPDKNSKSNSNILGIVSPHAGYSCSGPHAAHGYLELSKISNIDVVIILGTNHTGLGPPISVFPKGAWETPFGSVNIEENLHDQFIKLSEKYKDNLGIDLDILAHKEEHSIDNQVPFLQYSIQNHFTILPICLGDHRLDTSKKIAKLLHELIINTEKKVIIVSSSDFSHYLSPKEAEIRDRPVIENLIDGNLEEAVSKQKKFNASICGFGPILVLFALANIFGYKDKKELIYGHSGETCGSNDRVVAYSSLIISV